VAADPSALSWIRWIASPYEAARRSPFISPPKFEAVYSSSPLVENGNVVSAPRSASLR
jgi:hypothetical protein